MGFIDFDDWFTLGGGGGVYPGGGDEKYNFACKRYSGHRRDAQMLRRDCRRCCSIYSIIYLRHDFQIEGTFGQNIQYDRQNAWTKPPLPQDQQRRACSRRNLQSKGKFDCMHH